MASPKHFLDLSAVSSGDLRSILDDARTRKQATKAGTADKPLAGKMLAMIFEKPSTRTRVSCPARKCSWAAPKPSAIRPRFCRAMSMRS
jgi:ornithine carbamoyltransferase